MAKRNPPAQPRTRRTRTPIDDGPAQAADTAIASTSAVIDDAATMEPMDDFPSEDDIRVRAYHRYLERGGTDGMAVDDWVEAERELKNAKRG